MKWYDENEVWPVLVKPALNGVGPAGKSPVDYLKERQLKELKRIAKAARKLESVREDCHCVMPRD